MDRLTLIRLCDPNKDEKYSVNLWRWLKTRKNRRYDSFQVFATSPSVLFIPRLFMIGHRYENGSVSGTPLGDILSSGARAQRYCFVWSTRWIEIDWFWKKYVTMGKCALDPEHNLGMYPERWVYRNYLKTCKWCGETHWLEEKKRVVIDRNWRKSAAPGQEEVRQGHAPGAADP